MGITWRAAMPLLSTLAALVIIVHSAEENLNREHRYDLRPRVLDTRPSENEQPWRVVRADPAVQEAVTPDAWNNDSQDEAPVRRRLGRKRKRRPPSLSSDEIEPIVHDEDPEADETATQETETMKKRRKRLRTNRRNNESAEPLRPIRRRGQRRRRPSLENWPELSEFGAYPRNEKLLEANKDALIQTDFDDDEDVGQRYSDRGFSTDVDDEVKEIIVPNRRPASGARFVLADENKYQYEEPKVEDKSLSEFSMEVMGPLKPSTDNNEYELRDLKAKMQEKSPEIFHAMDKAKEKTMVFELDKYFDFKNEYIISTFIHKEERKRNKHLYTIKELIEGIKSQDKMDDSVDYRNILSGSNQNIDYLKKCREKLLAVLPTSEDKSVISLHGQHKREHGPIDPLVLKDILKRSNGTSLSEILQQHNLTLADLLNGKENAISVLKSQRASQNSETYALAKENSGIIDKNKDINKDLTTVLSLDNVEIESVTEQEISSSNHNSNSENASGIKDVRLNSTLLDVAQMSTAENLSKVQSLTSTNETNNTDRLVKQEDMEIKISSTTPKIQQRTSGMLARRPLPQIRRKLRMRPILNNTYKSQLNRDLMALSAKRYVLHHNRRNVTKGKSQEWREITPLMVKLNVTEETKKEPNVSMTTTSLPEDTTTMTDLDEVTETIIFDNPTTVSNMTLVESADMNKETTTITVEILATELDIHVTEKPIVNRSTINPSAARRQSYNNRLKKKRMKQKSTTEPPQDDIMKNLLELGDLVSSSEFIARTQIPKVPSPDDRTESDTELEDFLTTQAVPKTTVRSTRHPPTRKALKSTTVTKSPLLSSTEETAKIEIEEILNDTRTSAKLSKILRERNMTLSELFEHRERGSSHVHLADIFHNASREPNPPEPFLSKSLIEPISKETYPLRALLDANLHDPSTKATTIDPILANHVNIPVIMDFGNNVNENAENMGIMSLFQNYTKNFASNTVEKSTLQKDSKGTPYKSTIIAVNATDDDDDTTRESRMLDDEEDMISWNEIFSMIRKNHKNETDTLEKLTSEISPSGIHTKITVEEDADGDGVIVLEDLKHLKDLGTNTVSSSEEKIELNTLDRAEILEPGILNKNHNSAKSVTVATASIVGLAMILFLLTYAALKWRQQRSISNKKNFCDERIPSPVFENRKGTKNCSSRSISPMLPTSNIYTMNTLDSQTGKDSPEYMWDTLRKPFQ